LHRGKQEQKKKEIKNKGKKRTTKSTHVGVGQVGMTRSTGRKGQGFGRSKKVEENCWGDKPKVGKTVPFANVR